MCGRFTLAVAPSWLADEFGIEPPADYRPRYNIAPTQDVLAVRRERGEPAAVRLRWGLIPWWAKDPGIGNRLINARAETVATRPSFREPYRQRRCLVLADGFYEWLRDGRVKVPMRIHLAGGRPFTIAGLWDRWSPRGGEPVESCTLITTDASPAIADIHDRMPVIIAAADRDRWLDPGADPEGLGDLLRPYPADDLEAYAVSTLVNSPANDVPACVEPLPMDAYHPGAAPPHTGSRRGSAPGADAMRKGPRRADRPVP